MTKLKPLKVIWEYWSQYPLYMYQVSSKVESKVKLTRFGLQNAYQVNPSIDTSYWFDSTHAIDIGKHLMTKLV